MGGGYCLRGTEFQFGMKKFWGWTVVRVIHGVND